MIVTLQTISHMTAHSNLGKGLANPVGLEVAVVDVGAVVTTMEWHLNCLH